jgi:hypothetical protein
MIIRNKILLSLIGGSPGSRTLLDLLKREVHLPLCQRPIMWHPVRESNPPKLGESQVASRKPNRILVGRS